MSNTDKDPEDGIGALLAKAAKVPGTETVTPPVTSTAPKLTPKEEDDLKIPDFLYRGPYDKNAPLPSWVITAGSTQKREWVMPQKKAAVVVEKPAQDGASILPAKPKEPARPRAEGRLGTAAESVREKIREVMAAKGTIEEVKNWARGEPHNMSEAKAKRYVEENWQRVLKTQKK